MRSEGDWYTYIPLPVCLGVWETDREKASWYNSLLGRLFITVPALRPKSERECKPQLPIISLLSLSLVLCSLQRLHWLWEREDLLAQSENPDYPVLMTAAAEDDLVMARHCPTVWSRAAGARALRSPWQKGFMFGN